MGIEGRRGDLLDAWLGVDRHVFSEFKDAEIGGECRDPSLLEWFSEDLARAMTDTFSTHLAMLV